MVWLLLLVVVAVPLSWDFEKLALALKKVLDAVMPKADG